MPDDPMHHAPAVHVALLTLVLSPVLEVRNIGVELMRHLEVEVRDATTGIVHDDLLHVSMWWGIQPGAAVEFPMRRAPHGAIDVHLSWLDAADQQHTYSCVIEDMRRSAEAPCTVPDDQPSDRA